jgi:hypothetical protein
VVNGLSPGASYTFSVVAKNSRGVSAKSTSNRVAVAKSSAYFSSELDAFEVMSSFAETAISNAQTTAEEQSALTELTDSFDLFIGALNLEKWPSSTAANMASFVSDTRTYATDTVASIEASTASAAEENDVLQGAATTELLAEASVLTDLGFPSPINPPITTAPTAGELNTTETIHDFYGQPVSVTATQLVDPATAGPGSGFPDSGYRFVAVDLTVTNPSTNGDIEGDANYSTTVTGSDGQTYSADYGTVSGCTNFESGEFEIPIGDSATGCVVFELPTSVTVQSIQFTLAPGYLDAAEWNS